MSVGSARQELAHAEELLEKGKRKSAVTALQNAKREVEMHYEREYAALKDKFCDIVDSAAERDETNKSPDLSESISRLWSLVERMD